MKQVVGQQGEVRIVKLDALPEGFAPGGVERCAKGYIISHSERGHHHVLTGGDVMEKTDDVPEGMRIFHALLEEPAEFVQDAPHAHEAFALGPGVYEFRVSREYNPFADQARQVAD